MGHNPLLMQLGVKTPPTKLRVKMSKTLTIFTTASSFLILMPPLMGEEATVLQVAPSCRALKAPED